VNRRGKTRELRIVREPEAVQKWEWMLEVDSKINPKEREVDCEPKNQWNLKDLCDTRSKCQRTKERPEELAANKPIVNDCVPIVSQKSNIVAQITPIKETKKTQYTSSA
jgi:hypothetical protein